MSKRVALVLISAIRVSGLRGSLMTITDALPAFSFLLIRSFSLATPLGFGSRLSRRIQGLDAFCSGQRYSE